MVMPTLLETTTNDSPSSGRADRLAIVAGTGELPCRVVRNALKSNPDLVVFAMEMGTYRQCRQFLPDSQLVHMKRPGCLDENFRHARELGITQAVYVGKVSKWTLIKNPVFDKRTLAVWKSQKAFNDDSLMLALIHEFEKDGIHVLKQTDYMEGLFAPAGVYTRRQPSVGEFNDVAFGFQLAKEMGRLDVGQTVIIKNGMVLGVEAIEGTDQAILRTRRWAHKNGGVVVKVSKPNQDERFDVPTVGAGTLKSMKKAGLTVLAVEAGKTIMIDQDKLIDLANRWNMVVMGV